MPADHWNVSRAREEGRGQGLPGVVEGVKGLDGTLWIRSSVTLPTRQLTREEARSSHVDTHRPKLVSSRDQARELTAGLRPDLWTPS